MPVYTEIEIVAPSSAVAGSRVNVTIRVTNIDPDWGHVIRIACAAPFAGESIINVIDFIDIGETKTYPGLFTMPNEDAGIIAATWYPVGEVWHLDDYKEKAVTLAAPPEEYRGALSKKELEYNETRDGIPVY